MKTFALGMGLCVAALAFADMTIVQSVETSEKGSSPPRKARVTMLVKGGKMKVAFGDAMESIVDLGSGTAFTVDHARRQVLEQSLGDMKRGATEAAGAGRGRTFFPLPGDVKTDVRPTGRTGEVNGIACREYEVRMTGAATMTQLSWVSDDVDMKDLEAFSLYFQDMDRALFGGGISADLKGMLMRSETRYGVGSEERTTRVEVETISRDTVPGSAFDIPGDYRVIKAVPAAGPGK